MHSKENIKTTWIKQQIYTWKVKPTFLNRRLDLRASRIEASVLFTTDFPLSLACWVVRRWHAPTNFSCSLICEIIRLEFDGSTESSKNLSKYGMCSTSVVRMQDNAIVITFKSKREEQNKFDYQEAAKLK